jgi:TolB protein
MSDARLCAALVLLTLAASGGVAAQDVPGVVIRLEGSGDPIRIAVPLPRGSSASDRAARELVEVLRWDLDFAGDFAVVSPEKYSLVKDGGTTVNHEDWLGIGADHLLLTRLKTTPDRVDLDAWLYDNTTGTQLFAQRYGGTTDLLRRVAHKLSDEVVKHYTGRNGIALTRIAFVSSHGDDKEIYLMDYDGRRVRRLTTSGTINLSPAWSPPGDELAFVSWRGKPMQPGVYVMSSEGKLGAIKTVGGELSSAPDWSPDGRRLVYCSDAPGNPEIFLLDRPSGRNSRLTFNDAIDTSPVVSPNGREIAFTSDRGGSPQIYIMDAEGVNVRRVSSGSYNDSASWAPQGDRLAYASRIEGKFQIVVLDLTTGQTAQLTRGAANHEDPVWSPDGRHLVYSGNATGSYQIYTVRADGTRPRQLSTGAASFTPDWSQ